jgi:hypothetical protein
MNAFNHGRVDAAESILSFYEQEKRQARADVPQAAPPETTPYMPTLDRAVKDLMETQEREHRLLNEAATEANCDLDQVANVIRKLKAGAAAVPASAECKHCTAGIPRGTETKTGHFSNGKFVGWCRKLVDVRDSGATPKEGK